MTRLAELEILTQRLKAECDTYRELAVSLEVSLNDKVERLVAIHEAIDRHLPVLERCENCFAVTEPNRVEMGRKLAHDLFDLVREVKALTTGEQDPAARERVPMPGMTARPALDPDNPWTRLHRAYHKVLLVLPTAMTADGIRIQGPAGAGWFEVCTGISYRVPHNPSPDFYLWHQCPKTGLKRLTAEAAADLLESWIGGNGRDH
jgi:hypothetical protein